jgi:hypothetical protein
MGGGRREVDKCICTDLADFANLECEVAYSDQRSARYSSLVAMSIWEVEEVD